LSLALAARTGNDQRFRGDVKIRLAYLQYERDTRRQANHCDVGV